MKNSRIRPAAAVALLAMSTVLDCAATTITIDNIDVPGTGFNDTTAVSPVGGNSGTTLGAQRLIVFQQAAAQWSTLLNSGVPIVVRATMNKTLTCTASSATLGSAGALAVDVNFSNAPRANTSYVIAEANSLAGSDDDPGNDDIQAQFNANLDDGLAGCLNGTKWWYGIDPAVAPPAGTIPLLPVVFHELGHGLGFSAQTDTTTGDFLIPADPPVWSFYLFDTTTNKLWRNMTSVERLASLTNDPHLVWTGPRTNKQANEQLKPGSALIINSPVALAGAQEAGTAQFGPAPPANGTTGALVYVNDSVAGAGSPAGTVHDGCETPFAASVSGKIAVMDRGFCNFTVKVKNAQTQGAVAAIVVNNAVDGLRLPLTMSGSDATITIPAYSVTLALGTAIEADLPAPGVNATLGYSNIGVNQGCVRMFAPAPVLGGSSVSHFHADATPNLLMEPALNTSIFNKVDLALPLFADTDWSVNVEDFIKIDDFDPSACQHVQP